MSGIESSMRVLRGPVALLIAASFTLAACSQGSAFGRDFIRSCKFGGAPEAVCSCTYDKISSKYTDEEMMAFEGADASTAKGYFLDLRQAITSCAGD